jgi:hypothetical protein
MKLNVLHEESGVKYSGMSSDVWPRNFKQFPDWVRKMPVPVRIHRFTDGARLVEPFSLAPFKWVLVNHGVALTGPKSFLNRYVLGRNPFEGWTMVRPDDGDVDAAVLAFKELEDEGLLGDALG